MAASRDRVLVYEPATVPWAADEFVREQPRAYVRGLIYVLLLTLVSIVTYTSFATTAISIGAKGVLISEQPPVPIRLKTAIRVGELRVTEGQVVHQNDVLVVADDQLSEEDHDRLRKNLQTALAIAAAARSGECGDCAVRVERLLQGGFNTDNQGGIRETLVQVQELLKELGTSFHGLDQLDELTAEARRRISVASGKIAEIRRRKAEEILAPQLEQLRGEVSAAQNQITDRKQSLQAGVARALDRLEVKLQSLGPTLDQYRAQQKAVAPIDGVVTQVKVSGRGELVAAGTDLLQLIPLNSPLIAQLDVANKDIAEVHEGMLVVLRIDALPERQFGVAKGSVLTVPTSGVASKDGLISYPVLVRLEQQSFTRNGVESPFRLGMSLSGLVVTRHESLLSVGVRKLLNISDELVNQ